ncbi:MAG TPA: efflux RND transporter periplasmic adaptor subunit, partial [Blastocatellia bacterium]
MKTCALILCIALTLAGCKSHTDDTPPAPVVAVKIAKVEAADLQLSVRAPAVIFPRQQASVSSRIAARVRTLNARKGDQVSAGQTLAQLENSDLIAQRDEAKAVVRDADASLQKMTAGTLPTEIERARGQVLTAKATLDQAQKVYDRRKQLFDQGAIPQRELLVSETDLTHAKVAYDVALKSLELLEKRSREKDVEIAESRLDQAKARLAEINAQLEFTQIRSPFAGVITEQFMFTGDMARPDAPIFTVMDLSVAIARAQVPESEGRFIRQGQSGVFTPADAPDESFAGLITVVNQAI